MNRYHRYQNVNSYWYDEVPDHWKKTKNKYVFHQDKKVVGSSWEDHVLLTMGKSGVKPRDMEGGGKFPASFENYQVVTPNQIIFCLFDLDETPRTVGKSSDHGMITSAYDVFSTTPENDPQFWTYFYQMIDDHKGLRPYYTGLRKVVRSETFMGIEVFSPPIEEQKLISRYLDKKTSQIDSFVEKIQKKIELLKEQRTSLINHYVTKGLDPNVEMKDSGVEWIGEIPKHWEFRKLKDHYSYKKGSMGQKLTSSFIDENPGEYPVYSGQTSNNGILGTWNEFEFNFDVDVIFCTTVGAKLMTTRVLSGKFSLSQNCLIMIPKHNSILSSFINYFLMYDFDIRRDLLPSILQPSLRMEDLDQYWIPVPPLEEQIKIVNYVSEYWISFEETITKLKHKIDLLKEYRQSLISSVVTGKVRVTEDMI